MRKPIRTATFKPHSQRLALESRLVFDGAMAATVADVQPDNIDKPITDNTSTAAPAIEPPVNFLPEKAASVVDFQPSADSTTDSPAFFIEPDPLVSGAMTPVMDVKGDNAATSVIVVDPRADNAAALFTNPPANTQILTLDTTRDGFQQIADYLQTRHGVTQLDVLTWSDANHQQWLGNKALTGTIEGSVSNELALWGDGLSDKADIVFHGADKLSAGWLNYIDALTGGTSSWSQDDIALTAPVAQRSEIVFIESNVTDYQTLLNSVNPNADVYILDASKDGLAQMAHILNGRSGIDAIHIVSHGSTASVGLGSLMLTAQNLSEHNADLAVIGRTLHQNADILLYGCNVGAGSDGAAFIASLAQFTQADIAASIDVTGTADKNGNWVLEAHSGTIDSRIAFTDTVMADYHDVLGLVNGGATGTVTWSAITANTIVAGAITGITGGQVISVADNVLTGFDVYGKNNANALATNFTIRNMAGAIMTSGTGSYVRISGITTYPPQYMELRANTGIFDLSSIAVGSTDSVSSPTYNFALQALDSSFNPVGLPVSLIGQAQFKFGTINVASNSDFVGIYGVRITVNTGAVIAVDNIAVVNPRAAAVANTAPTFVQAGAGALNINENTINNDIKSLLHISDTDASQTETWTQSVAPTNGTLSFTSATASSGSADIITGGTITYTPNAGYAGTDSFTIQVSDGNGGTATRTINVNVNPLVPAALDLASATDSGSSNTDNKTNAAFLNFTGTSAAGDSTSKAWVFIDANANGVYNGGTDPVARVYLNNGSWTVGGLGTAAVADGTYNVYAFTTTSSDELPSAPSSALSITIDKTAPSITNVSIPNVSMKVGDTVTATLTVANDGGDTYTLGSSTIDGFTVSNLIRTSATTYTAQFTVTEGGADIAAASAIPLSLILTDTAGNSNTAYTTAISQAADAINARTPANMALSANTILTSAANNAVVGALSSTDGTSGDTFTYTLVAGAGSTDNASFNISGGNIQATTPSGLTAGAKSVRVRTTDAGGNFYEQTFSITVSAPANSNPVSSVNTGLTVLEDAAITTITTAMLNVTDAEQAASVLTYTLTVASTKGVLSKSGVTLGVGGTFTQADINSGIIKYTPNLNANGSDSVGFSVSDGAGGTLSAQTFTIGITAVNDAPILSTLFVENFDTLGLTGNSNAQYLTGLTTHYNSLLAGWQAAGNSTFHGVEVQTGNWAFMIYADNVGTQIATVAANTSGTTYTVNFDVAPSVHFISGQASDANDKVDIKVYDASNNLLADYQAGGGVMTANPLFIHKSFTYTGNGNGNIHFVIGSAFPGNNHFAGTIDNLSISSQRLTAINEDVLDASNTGNTVASIVVNGSITDVDYSPITSAPESIAVSAVDNTNGVWQYKIGAGAWIAFDFVANSGKALLLDSADSIRFVPNANWNGTVSNGITFYAWDKTSGSAGSYLTVSGNTGGTATLSTATDTASLVVNAVNDAPTFTGGVNTGLTVLEDAAITTITTAMLQITDVEQVASALTYTLTTASTKGVLSKSGAALGVGGTFTQADINSGIIKYTPNLNANGSDSVGFSVSDGAGGTLSGQTFTIGITAVNDAPSFTANSNLTAINEDTNNKTSFDIPNSALSNVVYNASTGAYNFTASGNTDMWFTRNNAPIAWFAKPSVANGQTWWAEMQVTIPNTLDRVVGFTVYGNADGSLPDFTFGLDTWAGITNISFQGLGDANPLVQSAYAGTTVQLRMEVTEDNSSASNDTYNFFYRANSAAAWTQLGGAAVNFKDATAGFANDRIGLVMKTSGATTASVDSVNFSWTATPSTVSTLFGSQFADVDSNSLAGIAVSANTANASTQGKWEYSTDGIAWFDVGSVSTSSALLLNATTLLHFTPVANFNGSPDALTVYAVDNSSAITFTNGGTRSIFDTSTDNATSAVSQTGVLLTTSITAVNDAPIASGSATLAAINEDNTTPSGASVSSLFSGNLSDVIDTVTSGSGGSTANTFAGIAISNYTVDAAKGAWQYKIGAGAWTALSSATTTAAITLASTDSLRFVPAADYNGAATALSANLIESGVAITSGGVINLTSTGTGGITSYSSATVALNHAITAVNDAPTGVGNLTLAVANENAASPAGAAINTLTGFSFTDVDTGATLKGVAVVGSGDGNWQYSTNGGTNWYSIGAVGIANTLVLAPTTLVRYLPPSNYIGTPFSLQVKALDDSYAGSFSTTAGAQTRVTLDATVNGGTTAIANASNTISTSVTDVNPVIANASVSLNENSVAGTAVTTVTAANDTNGLIYSITGGNTDVDADGNLAFNINASTGAITVNDAGDLNFETTPSFSLAVAVDDEDADTIADSTATITVNLQNLDEVAPTITSGATATAINENSGAGQVIYTVTSTDITDYVSGATAYSLSGTDAGLFSINSSTGAVTLTANPNFETKASYSFNVVATDAANNVSSKAVTLAINNLDEVAPTITSSATATAINENSGAGQVIYTVTSTDITDYVSGATAYSLSGTDAGLFSINSSTGAVTLTANPNFEAKASYSFNVVATDAANNVSTKAVTLSINDLNEAPSVTSGGTLSVAENSTGTVYNATGSDPDTAQTLSWTISGTDAALFSINSTSGALTFNTVPNFELPADNGADNVYDLTVIATDNGTGNLTASKALTITVTNVNEAPTTSAPASISVVEDVASALTGISFADVDAGSSSVTATLAVNSGTLSATSGGGVTVTGSGTASMTLAGTLANINAFIASSAVSFTTASNSISNVTLSSSLNDNGNSGSGGALSSAISTTTLTVTGIADTPSVASPTINEDIDSGAIAITRNAADGAEVTHYKITSITGGTLYSDAGFTTAITAGSFIASSGATTNVYFRPTANSNTAGSFTVQASTSNVDAGLGGATATSTINITPIADTSSVTSSTTTPATQTTSGLVISRNAVDGAEVTNFKITNIVGGTLYQNDGTTQITANSFITFAQANAGLKFTPSGVSNGSFDVQASTSNVDAGLGGAVSTATISLGIAIANANINEDTSTGAIAITGNSGFYKITSITGGTMYSDAGFTSPIANGGFIATSGVTTNVYFRPTADFNGTASFSAQGSSSNSDAGLTGNTATSTITVNPVNDAPTGLGHLTLPAVDEDTVSPAGAAINTLAGLNFTDVDAGASLSGVAVIANTANAATQGVWQYSTNGTNWYDIGTVTGNSAVALSATSLVRFVPALNFNGTPPSLTVRALDNTYAEGFTNGAVLVTTNANINGGSSGISANTNTIDTRIAAVNDAPVWSGLANTVNFTEDSAAVALGNTITLSDVDLNGLSYADSTLTLVRNGSANADDVFANTGTLGALTQGGNLTVNGVVIGTVTSNSAGLLTLTFNANATKALVNSALQQITYSNSSNTPPVSVQIMWLFNDNNTGAQGKGAALSAIRTTTVNITPTNDAPIAVNDSATVVNGGILSGGLLLANDSDPDNDTLTVNTTPITNVAHGALALYANGSYLYQHDGSAAKTDSFVYEITDGHGGKAQATVTMTISGSPLVQPSSGNVIFFDNFLTSGSLILLSNPSHYIDSDSRYVFEDKKQGVDYQYNGDYALPPVHLSLYVPLRYHIISVAGVLPQQTLIAQEFYVFNIPNWLFQHRNPYEALKFTATHLDGTALPEWIKLNPKTLTFFGLAPKGAQDVRVMMTIGDQYGNKVHSVFTIHVTDKVPTKNVVGEQRRAVGKSGFSEQLYSAGKVSKLQESRRLLDSLNHL